MATKVRGMGVPRTDAERAAAHYGITTSEYLAHPEKYPLPPRGTGLTLGTAAGLPATVSSTTAGINYKKVALVGAGLTAGALFLWWLLRR